MGRSLYESCGKKKKKKKKKLYISQSHKADQTSKENRPRRRTDAGEYYARKS